MADRIVKCLKKINSFLHGHKYYNLPGFMTSHPTTHVSSSTALSEPQTAAYKQETVNILLHWAFLKHCGQPVQPTSM